MLARVTREPALIVGVVTSGLGLAVLFGLEISLEQTAGIVTFLGALMALVRFLTTPASEVVVQAKPNGDIVAGAAASAKTGESLTVDIDQATGRAVLLPVEIPAENVEAPPADAV
jgi:hypothetical protein